MEAYEEGLTLRILYVGRPHTGPPCRTVWKQTRGKLGIARAEDGWQDCYERNIVAAIRRP